MAMLQRYVVIGCVLLLSILGVQAQSTPIEIGASVEAELDGTVPHLYTWSALESTVVSVKVDAIDDSLDPKLRILDSNGVVVVINDDFDYPSNSSAIVQAFVVPRTDTYTLEVSAFGDTSGAYELSILKGYDRLITRDNQVALSNWSVGENRVFATTPVNENLFIEAEGISQVGTLLANHFPQHADMYFEVMFSEITASTNWQVGIVFRHTSPTSYYRLVVNDQGFWQLEYVGDEETTVVQSWSTHPVIVPGVPEFTLGILASGESLNVVYDGQLIGTVYDQQIMDAGAVGVTAITANALNSRVAFMLESAQLTVPTLIDDQLQFPDMLIGQNPTAYANLLERQGVIPVGGEIRLTSPQTEIRYVEPGVSRFPAASGIAFGEFIIGGTVTISSLGEGVGGCGITFHETEENHYTLAYVNTAGEYGVSRRDDDIFEAGIYGDQGIGDEDTHSLIVVVLEDILYLYIDDSLVGTMPYRAMSGEIGTAVVNFDGGDTTCTIEDLWLWDLGDSAS